MSRFISFPIAVLSTILIASAAYAEYCIDWKSWLQSYAGQSGHCWPSESECNSYYFSRCMNSNYKNDCAGPCYFKPGLYPKTGASKAVKSDQTVDNSAQKAAENLNKTKEALKKAAYQKQFAQEKEKMLQGMKDVTLSPPSNQILLKPIPPARSQLDCIANNDANRSWGQRAPDCTPVIPNVPEPPSPVEASGNIVIDPAMLAQFIESLHQRVSQTRDSLIKQDETIKVMEKEVIAFQGKDIKEESDALKRAREALAKAKADRERTAHELSRLEQQEKKAQSKNSRTP
ncbi:hypothetical protein Sulku_1939 [Sulfuricurvum kujiense DSM 16994]|uniref:ShKT domain-containing protein n=1 Tax=Sulfuricurvum kujiense (strain ATCC BAA-921 / DSM 16994 / JCM 11577 / YK-1) TaxID=709032 RepID=E4U242_SULKY|nr:hypothetical protein [Sulfuricurvum kujiense]ADR34599.1 hypothetical protein Sulku_1939 [Sulfuricurvum kujiense DSM 16994]